MRVLFTTYAEKTHFLAMAPLAWALRTAGHEVVVASQPRFAPVITQAGLTAVTVGADRDPYRLLEANPGHLDGGRVALTPPYDAADDSSKATPGHLLEGYREAVTWWHRLINQPMIADLVAYAKHWRPDLVIWEPLTYAGAIAANAVGAAHGRLMWGLDVFGVTRDLFLKVKGEEDPLADWLGGHARRYGGDFSEDLVTGQFTIDRLPRSLRLEAGLTYLPMRYVPYGGAATVPAWLRTPPERPRVAITMGFSAADHYGGFLWGTQDLLDAVGGLDVDVVATISDAERAKLTRVPPNARLTPYVPLHALTPTCAAVVHHAGPGTLATTALDAVPQLALPMHFDEPPLARMLAEQGAGLALAPGEADGVAVAENVLRLLKEPAFTARAETLRDEMLAMPSPNELVPRLEHLARR